MPLSATTVRSNNPVNTRAIPGDNVTVSFVLNKALDLTVSHALIASTETAIIQGMVLVSRVCTGF